MYNEEYSLPMELAAEKRIFSHITFRTLCVILFIMFFTMNTMEGVYEALRIPYSIFNGIVAILLCVHSNSNYQKRLYQSVIITLFRDRTVYKPIDNPNKLPETVTKYNRMKGSMEYVEPESDEE